MKETNHPPWFDKETFNLHQKKTKLRLKFKETQRSEDYERYSDCRKEFKMVLNEKMRSYVEDDSDSGLLSKKFWKYLKSTSGSSRVPETVNYGSRFRNNPSGQSELFNEFFCDQFSAASNYDIDIDFSNDTDFNIDFNFRIVRKFLKDVNPNKAAGPDGIHGKILKNCAVSLAYPLSVIFRVSYNSGMIPKDWKLANVVPVYKKGSKTSVENYRPISLTRGGCSPKKNQKKPVATPKLANWHWFFWFFLVFFGFLKFPNWHWFFLVFFGFFWHWFWPEFEIGNWFFLVFFGFFWFFLVFFGLSFGQHSKLETGFWVFLVFFGFFWDFLVFFGFFWHLILWLECHPKKNQKKPKKTKKNQKNPKKTKKKPVATPKLVNWLGFFWFFLVFFGFFWGEHPPH